MKDKRILLLAIGLLLSTLAFANAGMVDRYMEEMTSFIATCCTVYAVQLLLGIIALLLPLWKKDNRITWAFSKGASYLASNDYLKLLCGWFLTAFVLTPYLALLDNCLLLIGALLLSGIFSILFVAIPALRRWITKEKTICVMLHLSFSAFVGYHIYYLIWDSTLIQNLFSQDDEAYPGAHPCYTPDQLSGLNDLFEYGLYLLAITLIPWLVAAIVLFIKERKHRKADIAEA